MKNSFYATKEMFNNYINYSKPLAFHEWDMLPEDEKAAVLFLQFFDQITLAWEKLKSVYSLEEDGVSEVLQYLQKNVAKIHNEPKRFTPAYIYTVSYNCLYCLCRDANKYKRAYENETSNIQVAGEDEIDIFDLYAEDIDMLEEVEVKNSESARSEFWAMVEDLDVETQKVIAKLMEDPTCLTIKKGKAKQFSQTELDNISDETVESVRLTLMEKLAPYRAAFAC